MEKEIKWKPVKLEGNFLNEALSDLIGIEELTDYNLQTLDNTLKKNKKRKLVDDVRTKPNEIKKSKDNAVPGKYVLNPHFIKKVKKKTKKQKSIRENIEVGTKVLDTDKCLSTNDMLAWFNFGLSSELIHALAEQGFKEPTQIQYLTLTPAILGRRDILGAAETGSGKTLAFGLPIINGIIELQKKNINIMEISNKTKAEDSNDSAYEDDNQLDEDQVYFNDSSDELEWQDDDKVDRLDVGDFSNNKFKPLYALILTPTRELAVQVKNHLVAITKGTNIRIAVIVGGMASVKQERVLSKCPEIVVATPGRLWELIQEGNPHLNKIDYIRYLAIDETDRMVERGHFQELHNLLERLNSNSERKQLRQNFVFSATLTLVHDLPKHLLKLKKFGRGKSVLKLTPGQKIQKLIDMVGMTNPKVVDITRDTGTAVLLTECRITCPIEDKDYYLYYFLKRHPGRTLVFCNSVGCVKRLTTLFNLLQCNPLPLHANMAQKQRLKNLERFRDDPEGVLIATDVAARGLDVPQVQHVIHYQVPRTAENYVHRSGRTARAMTEGITVVFMEPAELKSYIRLCHTLGKTEDLPLFPVADNLLSAVKQRVNLARDLDKIELKTRRLNSETGWIQKAADEMDIIIDERDRPVTAVDKETLSKQKRIAVVRRKQLADLLSKPIFPKGFSFKYPSTNTNLIESNLEKDAIKVMKSAIENYAKSGNNKLGSLMQRMKKSRNVIKREKKVMKQKRKDLKKKQKKKQKENGDDKEEN